MKTKTFILSLFLLCLIFTAPVLAVGKPNLTGKPEKQLLQTHLPEAKLRACQAKESAIKKRMKQLIKLATTMQEKFDAIAGRVEEYYASKVVPSGKTVANYDSLVADIQTKKGAVQTALTTAQGHAGSFACDGNDPKGQLTQFREDMQAVKSALKDYRTAIKNLIVAVHSTSNP